MNDINECSMQLNNIRPNRIYVFKINLWNFSGKWFLFLFIVLYFYLKRWQLSSMIILNKKAFLSSEHPVVEIPLRRVSLHVLALLQNQHVCLSFITVTNMCVAGIASFWQVDHAQRTAQHHGIIMVCDVLSPWPITENNFKSEIWF